MNKIIIIIIILIGLILYFTYRYDKENMTLESNTNIVPITTLLTQNNLSIDPSGNLAIKTEDENYPIRIENKVIKLGKDFEFDSLKERITPALNNIYDWMNTLCSVSYLADISFEKLNDRHKRNVIKGDGNNR